MGENMADLPSFVKDSEGAAPKPVDTMMDLPPSKVDYIPPLVHSVLFLLRLRGKVMSAASFMAGLTGGDASPGSCLLAARQAGLDARISYRKSIRDIPKPTFPCVLLLNNNRSCVLSAIDNELATVFFPETAEAPQTVHLVDLEDDYSGYTLFGTLESRLDQRAASISLVKSKRWFWDVLVYYMPIYKHVALASIVTNIIGALTPLFVMNVYDRVVPNNAITTLWVLAIGVLLAYFFDFLLRNLRSHFVDVAGRNADVVLSSRLLRKVLTMRFDSKPDSTGALVNNIREFESLREFFGSSTLLAFIDLPFLAIFLLLISYIAGPLVFLPLAAIPILIISGLFIQAPTKRSAEHSYKQNMQKNALLVEIVNGLETVRTSMAESQLLRQWEELSELSASAGTESRKYKNLAVTVSTLITQLVTVSMVVWGVFLIADGTLTMGGLIGCNILVGRTMAPLMQIATLLTRLQSSRMALQALDLLMNLPSEGQHNNDNVDFGYLEPSFELDGLTFGYPGSERLALQNVSLSIAPGERVCIVGRMGAGKSVLGKLLMGLFQPREGAVKFGGVDIRQMSEVDLRNRIGYLPQDVVLFYGSIRDNIALSNPSMNDQLVLRAATIAGVTNFIRSSAAGFGAQVGERGMSLSGGQRQAVALARSLVNDPDVLILDEPTSNMDNASERAIIKRLASVIEGKTVIIITHRMSLLDLADRLIVIDGGRVIDDGPKQEVLQRLRGTPASRKK